MVANQDYYYDFQFRLPLHYYTVVDNLNPELGGYTRIISISLLIDGALQETLHQHRKLNPCCLEILSGTLGSVVEIKLPWHYFTVLQNLISELVVYPQFQYRSKVHNHPEDASTARYFSCKKCSTNCCCISVELVPTVNVAKVVFMDVVSTTKKKVLRLLICGLSWTDLFDFCDGKKLKQQQRPVKLLSTQHPKSN